jgi:G3E family GTPase
VRGAARNRGCAARDSSHLPNAAGPVVVHFVQHVAHSPVELEDWPDDDRQSRMVFVTRGLAREPVAQLFASVGAVAAGVRA